MIQMAHGPTIAPMPTDGSLLFTNEVFEWVCSTRPFTYDCLIVCPKMSFRFCVNRLWTDGIQMLLFRTFQVLAVGPSLGLARGRIVVGFQNLVDECDHLCLNLSESAAVVVMGKQPKKATAVAHLSDSIQLLPVLPGASWDRRSLGCYLYLFVVLVVFRVNDAITEQGRGKIGLTGLFEQSPAFCRKGISRNWKRGSTSSFTLLRLRERESTCCLSSKKHRSVPGFTKPVCRSINVQIVPGDGNVDQIGRNPRLGAEV